MKSIIQVAATVALVALATALLFSSCKKEEREKEVIVDPTACFAASDTTIVAGESIDFTDCSESDKVHIYFPLQGDESQFTGLAYQFDQNDSYTHVFDEPGIYTATVSASNTQPGSRIAKAEKTITVQ